MIGVRLASPIVQSLCPIFSPGSLFSLGGLVSTRSHRLVSGTRLQSANVALCLRWSPGTLAVPSAGTQPISGMGPVLYSFRPFPLLRVLLWVCHVRCVLGAFPKRCCEPALVPFLRVTSAFASSQDSPRGASPEPCLAASSPESPVSPSPLRTPSTGLLPAPRVRREALPREGMSVRLSDDDLSAPL